MVVNVIKNDRLRNNGYTCLFQKHLFQSREFLKMLSIPRKFALN